MGTLKREKRQLYYNKHFMTGPKGNSEFCLPETSMFPEAKFLGETKLTVSLRASHEVFCYTSQLKT